MASHVSTKRSHLFFLLTFTCITCLALSVCLVSNKQARADGTTYYVDCSQGANGDGSQGSPWNSLTSVNNHGPFQPGDAIYFLGGVTCTGELAPQGSGNSTAPIVIGSYGPAGFSKGIINGAGAQPAAVYLNNQQYWEINGIEVSNNTGSTADRAGIRVDNSTNGLLSHIHIINNSVHDVAGYTNGYYGDNGGIVVNSVGTGGGSQWDDVLIGGNTIKTVNRVGIFVGQDTVNHTDGGASVAESTHVVIQNNSIDDSSGDGIIAYRTNGAVVQQNVLSNSGARAGGSCQTSEYCNQAIDGIWTVWSDNALVQYNEVYNQSGGQDGEGYDIDFNSVNATYQYNYSHDNNGGFLLVVPKGGSNDIVRDNISQNDHRWIFGFYTAIGDLQSGTIQIYNNSFYSASSVGSVDLTGLALSSTLSTPLVVTNNIVDRQGGGGYTTDSNATYDHNIFFGNASYPTSGQEITSDPQFTNPGGAGTGISTASAYHLQSGSPAINAGTLVSNNGGRDFFGNTVCSTGNPNIGADNSNNSCGGSSGGGSNLVQNPGFETGDLSSWTGYNGTTVTTTKVHSGTYAVEEPSSGADLEQTVSGLSPNTTYTLTGYAEVANSGEGVYIGVKNYGGSEQNVYLTSSSYTQGTVTFTTGASNTSARIYLYKASGSGPAYGDDFSLIASSATNLVQNPGFETGSLSNWNGYSGTTITTSNVHSGTYAVEEPSSGADLEQTVSGLSPNTTYTLTGYAEVANSGEGVYIGVKNYGGSEQNVYITSTSYTQGTVTFTTGASNTSALIYLYKASGSGPAYGDDFSLT